MTTRQQHSTDIAVPDRVQQYIDRPTTEGAAKDAAIEWLGRHRDIRAIAGQVSDYEHFVLSYIQREQARFRASGDDHPYQGTRETKVCTCDAHNCPLKKGRLPREIAEADDLNEGIREFRQRPSHNGDPLVLSEARQVYAEVKSAVDEVHLQAQRILLNWSDDYEAPAEDITLGEETRQALDIT
jgi:hypothetical protein